MDKTVRELVINKIGSLQVANAELAAENIMLVRKCAEQAKRIAEMEGAQKSLPLDNHPANPYELPNGAH